MEEMFVNVENLVMEAHDQIEKDPAFVDSCVKAMVGTADRRIVVRRMLNSKIKPIVTRYMSVIAEAESRQSDSIH